MNKMFLILTVMFLGGSFLFSQEVKSTEIAGVTIEWLLNEDNIEITLSAETTGWIAIGFDPENKMKGADIIIGYVSNDGELVLEDHYGNSQISHKSDISSGGMDNLTVLEGSEMDGITAISFQIPLNSGDELDKILEPGKEYKIIAAYGKRDNVTSHHQSRGSGYIEL